MKIYKEKIKNAWLAINTLHAEYNVWIAESKASAIIYMWCEVHIFTCTYSYFILINDMFTIIIMIMCIPIFWLNLWHNFQISIFPCSSIVQLPV